MVKIFNRTEGCHVFDLVLNEILDLPRKITFITNRHKPGHFIFKGEAYHIILVKPQYYESRYIYIETEGVKNNVILLEALIPLVKANVSVSSLQLMDWNFILEHAKPMPYIERDSPGTKISYDTIWVRIAEVHSIDLIKVPPQHLKYS